MKRKTRIYVVGPISDSNCIQFLRNIREGMRECVALMRSGFHVICPFSDYSLVLADDMEAFNHPELTHEMFYEHGLENVKIADYLYVYVKNYYHSKGTLAEIELAKRLGKRVYFKHEYPKLRQLPTMIEDESGVSVIVNGSEIKHEKKCQVNITVTGD